MQTRITSIGNRIPLVFSMAFARFSNAKVYPTVTTARLMRQNRFDSRQWVNQWLDCHVPVLGGKPRTFLGTEEGRTLVKNVLDLSWSGAYG